MYDIDYHKLIYDKFFLKIIFKIILFTKNKYVILYIKIIVGDNIEKDITIIHIYNDFIIMCSTSTFDK